MLLGKFISFEGVSDIAIMTLGILMATLALQIFETFNLCVSCLLSSGLLFLLGCTETVSEAFSGYANHVLYFTIASFGISAAFQKSALSKKILSVFIKGKKLSAKRITLIFMCCAGALSSVMSNVAAVIVFLPYLEKYLTYYQNREELKRTSRSMNICLVVSAMIGGMITSAGSSVNIIGLDLLEKYAGISIRFIEWMAFGLPMAAIMLIVSFFVVTSIFKPVDLSEEVLNEYIGYINNSQKMSVKDIYWGADNNNTFCMDIKFLGACN